LSASACDSTSSKRKREALGHDNADLTLSGRLLNDIQITDIVLDDERAYVELGWE
jgi:hypothetical protein